MEILSWKFFLFIVVAVLVLSLRAKHKRKGPTIVRGKQISIRGQKLVTRVTKTTPLACLMDEGKLFGEDFKEKTPPALPHTDLCTCELISTMFRSHDLFNEKKMPAELYDTDLGKLTRNEFRYYKFMLIIGHADADEQIRIDHRELIDRIAITEQFKQQVASHLEADAS